MAIVKAEGLTDEEVARFDEVARLNEMSRSEFIRYIIRNISTFPEVLDAELRMKAIVDDIVAHLDLNTKILMKNIELGYLPPIIEKAEAGNKTN
ncbi:CopG family transcriptional regulator [Enterococcus termitis]|uniref:Ribbon-helix-helix protein CopG domain-containing protein n=1 Tax=Enterococcus termitis TaxID=332950 RepID=A0A1E5H117_9ENTE|nr:CopG family transcriptional regulator [Enterococcus termitis]OEG18688.1 hypothetical protein BCR25_15935 [Enterococcus termitis]OJG97585.1 hypothetical protein RV18_GL000653 [Enterococcus termitis]